MKQQRLESNGNYDAMFAKVCNFHWSFLPDGSYDITLDLVSIGDIVESFKINMLTGGPVVDTQNQDSPKDKSELTSTEIIDLYANQSSIGQYFYNLIGKDDINQSIQQQQIAQKKEESKEAESYK
jgi:hypothetical protein